MADYVPLILLGGLAIGGFILWQNGTLNNLFSPPAAAAPVSGTSASTSATSSTTSTACMGTDILSGQPCPCPSTMAMATVITPAPGGAINETLLRGRGANRRIIYPTAGATIPFPGSVGIGIPASSSTTCDCSRCGSSASSILGGISPSQFSTAGGDLNSFVGQSIARAGYHI